MDPSSKAQMRLTSLSHGGGCGCKISPAVLSDILKDVGMGAFAPALLVGSEHCDDAAVLRINKDQAIVATTDFFMPIVDDPFDFGRIAATNALSDVYAMGGRPVMALAIVGMPIAKLGVEDIRQICAGGAKVCTLAGIPLAGGHSIDSPEPIYGLVAIGLVNPERVLTNAGARDGDVLILTKPLGVGIYSAMLRRGELSDADYRDMIDATTRLNTIGADLPDFEGVHAATDVTGFGLLGHTLEMCRASRVGAVIDSAALPCLPKARSLLAQGVRTGASDRNWASYGAEVDLPHGSDASLRDLLTDPQTSGGLLIAVAPHAAEAVLQNIRTAGFREASAIGRMSKDIEGAHVR
jgi:selenide,water dikinase